MTRMVAGIALAYLKFVVTICAITWIIKYILAI